MKRIESLCREDWISLTRGSNSPSLTSSAFLLSWLIPPCSVWKLYFLSLFTSYFISCSFLCVLFCLFICFLCSFASFSSVSSPFSLVSFSSFFILSFSLLSDFAPVRVSFLVSFCSFLMIPFSLLYNFPFFACFLRFLSLFLL